MYSIFRFVCVTDLSSCDDVNVLVVGDSIIIRAEERLLELALQIPKLEVRCHGHGGLPTKDLLHVMKQILPRTSAMSKNQDYVKNNKRQYSHPYVNSHELKTSNSVHLNSLQQTSAHIQDHQRIGHK